MGRLAEHVDELTDDFMERFGSVDDYGPDAVTADDIRQTAASTMRLLVLRLSGEPIPSSLRSVPEDLGARRARQGVPLDLLLEAVRLDFRVLWKTLEHLAGPGSHELLVRNVERVLSTVDAYVIEVQQSFVAEQARLTRDSSLLTARYVSRLFSSDLTRPDILSEIAEGLKVPMNAEFEVAVIVGEGIVRAQQLLARGDLDSTWLGYNRGGGFCLFRPQRRSVPLPPSLLCLPGGYIQDIAGLAGVPAAAAAAASLARHGAAEVSTLASVDDAWIGVAHDLVEDGLPGFSRRVWTALDSCTPHERGRLLDTVLDFARTGSIKETAARLFCHRNTIVNRLRSFKELTGLDMTVPNEGAMALIALGDSARVVANRFPD
jgi:hypothetical protein